MKFSENLKEFRLTMCLTQKQMAGMLGITERGYRNYELGRNQPSLEDLIKIADRFDVSLDALVGRVHPKDALMDSEQIL